MKRWCKFFYLILFIHFFACATAPTTQVASDQGGMAKEKLPVEEVAAAELTVEEQL